MIRHLIYLAISLLAFWLGVNSPPHYKYEDVKDYITLLSGVSGMVFTIMGIWIAFIYPQAIQRLANPSKIAVGDFSETFEDTKRLESIVAAILESGFVAVVLAIVLFLKIILWNSQIYLDYRDLIRSGALATILFCTFIQFEAIASVAIANVLFLNDLHRKRQDRQQEAGN